MKGDIIVLEDGKFKVIYNEEDRLPDNFAMRHAIRNDWNPETYQVPGRDIKFRWINNGTYQGNSFRVIYQDETIETYNAPNITNVCQAMNYYLGLSKEELENLGVNIKDSSEKKSELEEKIEKLEKELNDITGKTSKSTNTIRKAHLTENKIHSILNYNRYFSAGDMEYGIDGPELVDGKIYISVYHYLEFMGKNPRNYDTFKMGAAFSGMTNDIKKCKYLKQNFEIKKYSFELIEENKNLVENFAR